MNLLSHPVQSNAAINVYNIVFIIFILNTSKLRKISDSSKHKCLELNNYDIQQFPEIINEPVGIAETLSASVAVCDSAGCRACILSHLDIK